MLRAVRIVLTCRPRSGATPAGNVRLTTRHLDADTSDTEDGFALAWTIVRSASGAVAGDATISTQHGAAGASATAGTCSATGATSGTSAGGPLSPLTTRNTAAGASTDAKNTDGLRRSLTSECLPTKCNITVNAGKYSIERQS